MPELNQPESHQSESHEPESHEPESHQSAPRPVPAAEMIDPDVDLRDLSQPPTSRRGDWDVLASAAFGGVLGAEARYGLSRAVTHHGTQFPWSTLVTNVSGCFLLGVLMVLLLELMSAPPRLARPFLGVGVLGGYTTFSTFAVDTQRLLMAHRPGVAAGYLASTVLLGAIAIQLGTSAARSVGRRARSSDVTSSREHPSAGQASRGQRPQSGAGR